MWARLEKWQNNLDIGMTKEKYLAMMEQLGQEPSETKCPPDIEDFPLPLQQAIEVFNRLGDRVVADIGYIGKNHDILPLYIEALKINNLDMFLEALARLDASMIKRSQEQMKQARDKIKKKG